MRAYILDIQGEPAFEPDPIRAAAWMACHEDARTIAFNEYEYPAQDFIGDAETMEDTRSTVSTVFHLYDRNFTGLSRAGLAEEARDLLRMLKDIQAGQPPEWSKPPPPGHRPHVFETTVGGGLFDSYRESHSTRWGALARHRIICDEIERLISMQAVIKVNRQAPCFRVARKQFAAWCKQALIGEAILFDPGPVVGLTDKRDCETITRSGWMEPDRKVDDLLLAIAEEDASEEAAFRRQ